VREQDTRDKTLKQHLSTLPKPSPQQTNAEAEAKQKQMAREALTKTGCKLPENW